MSVCVSVCLCVRGARATSQIWEQNRCSLLLRTRQPKFLHRRDLWRKRDNDEGYLDINLALNALESAYIQLTGNPEAKESFFPEMRKRLKARGHKIADYDVLL